MQKNKKTNKLKAMGLKVKAQEKLQKIAAIVTALGATSYMGY